MELHRILQSVRKPSRSGSGKSIARRFADRRADGRTAMGRKTSALGCCRTGTPMWRVENSAASRCGKKVRFVIPRSECDEEPVAVSFAAKVDFRFDVFLRRLCV